MRIADIARKVAVAVTALLLAACVQNHHRLQETLTRPADREARILVLPADVELHELSFGGAPSPRRDWTAAAQQHVNAALQAYFAERSIAVIYFDGSLEDEETAKLMRLHASVGQSIKLHQYDGPNQLPTKKGTFNWTMGPDVRRLAARENADYVFFVYIRDSYSGPGRVAAQVIAVAVFGIAIPGGIQAGFASMVDMNTGDFVWFNRLQRGAGDLRTAEPAKETITALLEGMPK